MTATLTERSAVPFHLGLTEPVDETTIDDCPAVEGAYDPVEQIWKLPAGTSPDAYYACESLTLTEHGYIVDDIHVE